MGKKYGGPNQGADGKIPVDELPERIEEYFQSCKPKYVLDKDGKVLLDGDKPVFTMNAPTINGLCRFLGYTSPTYMNTVMRHPNSPRADIMQKAMLRIAEWHESRLADKNAQGSMMWLRYAQKEIWGDQPQTHLIAGLGNNLRLTEEEAKNFKANLAVLIGREPDADEVEEPINVTPEAIAAGEATEESEEVEE